MIKDLIMSVPCQGLAAQVQLPRRAEVAMNLTEQVPSLPTRLTSSRPVSQLHPPARSLEHTNNKL